MARWTFAPMTALVKRDPFEAEFFNDAEASATAARVRTDALVRETVQNATDAARDGGGEVRVRLAIREVPSRPDWAAPYLDGLRPHLRAPKLGLDLPGDGPFRWLAYEDFGTRGLCGDVGRVDDPEPGDGRQDFYWFWRNVGRSGKGSGDLGRWGLGKTVLPAAGRVNAMLGLTVRAGDGQRLLMGQAVLKTHKIGGTTYFPEGFYHGELGPGGVPLPVEDAAALDAFTRDFALARQPDEPGLSVVVPHALDGLRADDLLRSAIVHWFVPILRGRLAVEVVGPDAAEVRVDAGSIRDVAAGLEWRGTKKEKKHRPPPLDFADWACDRRDKGMPHELRLAGVGHAPRWSEELFGPESLRDLRRAFAAGDRVAVRVPVQIERRRGGPVDSHFDVFLESDPDLPAGEDDFVRDGMSVSGVRSLGGPHRGHRGLVIVDDEPLSALLGDTEGPAHTEWKTTERRPEETYKTWASRVLFVRDGPKYLLQILEPPSEGLDTNLLRDVFGFDDPERSGGQRGKRPKLRPDGTKLDRDPADLPEPVPRWYRVAQSSGGFRVRRSSAAPLPPLALLAVAAAYDLPDGDPLRNHYRFDFDFEDLRRGPVEIKLRSADVRVTGPNSFEVAPTGDDFEVHVAGFDKYRDLYVRAAEVGGDAAEGEAGDGVGTGDESDAVEGGAP